MTKEEKQDLLNAIDEFYDNDFHPSIKPEISDKAKAVALKCMLIVEQQEFPELFPKQTKCYYQKDYDGYV